MPNLCELDKARKQAERSATAWFAVLERARITSDFELAAKAVRKLARLGVKVRYTGPNRKGVNNER